MLKIKNVSISYKNRQVVKNVSVSLGKGEIVGIVGESGSGKSTLVRSVLRLLPDYARITKGEILFHGKNMINIGKNDLRKIRGNDIAMIFQHAELSLDPLWTIGRSFYESIRMHRNISFQESMKQGEKILADLLLENPKQILRAYPFQLSGGMCQRVSIAIAMANRPEILLADEPTSALDVTVQKQVMDIMLRMRQEYGTAIFLISHNISVISQLADKVGVLYQGELVEWGKKEDVLYRPKHVYTRRLIRAIPRMDGRLPQIEECLGNA